ARTRPRGEVFHLCGSGWLSPFELGRKIARHCGFSEDLVQSSSMEEYRKVDPRPRQKALRMSNEKWRQFAEKHGLAAPLTLDEGLNRVWPRNEKL
ncbi:MAG: sugar nucleotide-binding protein, partial [Chloroflexi bacterium]|nr:sugar nucleotide-binding protein [Chloroflexota bacterium]